MVGQIRPSFGGIIRVDIFSRSVVEWRIAFHRKLSSIAITRYESISAACSFSERLAQGNVFIVNNKKFRLLFHPAFSSNSKAILSKIKVGSCNVKERKVQ